jgi:hypothetical protein
MTRPMNVSPHARRGARFPWFRATRAAALSVLVAAGTAHAAVLTPEQTTDLYLGAFVNGDVAKAVQFNDAMRTRFDGKDALDVAAVSKLGDTMRERLVTDLLSSMPPKSRAALRGPIGAAITSYQQGLARSECKATGSTQKPNEYVEDQSIATVDFSCRVVDIEPGVKALKEKLGNPRLKTNKALTAFITAYFSGIAKVYDDAPMGRTVTGQLDLYGKDERGWITGSPGDVLSPLVDALLDPISTPDGEAGQ